MVWPVVRLKNQQLRRPVFISRKIRKFGRLHRCLGARGGRERWEIEAPARCRWWPRRVDLTIIMVSLLRHIWGAIWSGCIRGIFGWITIDFCSTKQLQCSMWTGPDNLKTKPHGHLEQLMFEYKSIPSCPLRHPNNVANLFLLRVGYLISSSLWSFSPYSYTRNQYANSQVATCMILSMRWY